MSAAKPADSAQSAATLPSLERYRRHLELAGQWLIRSIKMGRGGSCAHFSPLLGWSDPYPETTGYLIPTLLHLESRLGDSAYGRAARSTGEWLLGIQGRDGSWPGGLYRPGRPGRSSVFNSGQIIKGMVALHDATRQQVWLDAAERAAHWLAGGVGADGQWRDKDYRSSVTPSYYTHVAW